MVKYLSRAIKEAKKSPQRFRHAALLIKGGAIVSFAFNTHDTHAEVRAIRRCKEPETATLISIRVTNDGLANAWPCFECWEAIDKARIRAVIASKNQTEFEYYDCRGTRQIYLD